MSPQEKKQQNLKAIYQALLQLMSQKPMISISITELCQNANVSRTYFYRHYQNFDQIILAAQAQAMLHYLRRLPSSTVQVDLATLMTHYFKLTKTGVKTYQLLIKNNKINILLQTFQTVFQLLLKQKRLDNHSSKLAEPYYLDFFSGAVVNMSIRWVNDGLIESPEYLGQQVAKFVHS
ncbi:TetR/AcrR family transcriptional regulator [Lactiplantibacillus xiangfangensis]|uniref:Transcription regulator n=1 Tax=Lactiplantibacillus xiangfangensis TaxID=942150 RepID=A0A0R2MKX9_9LACO|nr:TetR/AcrR family transcriptional regulator [Lactiplantibacillus xiangfangensis]KRO14383.1 transcription regulator [Lactiplantibacillus xiangfangensis]